MGAAVDRSGVFDFGQHRRWLALGDQSLREAPSFSYPAAWKRIQARRQFMNDILGIALHPDVLPFSNVPACLAPFLLRSDRAMSLAI